VLQRLQHVLDIASLTREQISFILDQSKPFQEFQRHPLKKLATLRGKTVAVAFFEASTRTRISFTTAASRLGADTMSLQAEASSLKKGESLIDTVRTLEAMRPDGLVIRHSSSGAAAFVAQRVDVPVLNAGDGTHEHPTQALLDALIIKNVKGKLGGLVVAICGDILHSRVARSNALLLGKMGAEVRLVGPRTMMPAVPTALGNTVRALERLEDAVKDADVVMMLRIQQERLAGVMMATTREYSRRFGLGQRVLDLARPDAIVMHPGPINRGVELDPSVADGPRSVILDQVEAGVAVRMAVLELLVGTREGSSAKAPS
jgi:aspartate carbamoyltransferase catalytic subunit